MTETEKTKIYALLDKGWSNEAIAEIIGVTRTAVRYWRKYRKAGEQTGG